jgi:arginyl-tRNA synthetase
LARTINSAFVQLQVKGSEQKLAEARLVLFESGRIVLNTGMKLLGLQPVERM